ncbi:serine hydrolase [Streptomyces sp. M19]
MPDTRFRPPASWLPRVAATEDQRRPWGKLDRGMLRGRVHDENAHALGGVAGHAGLFSTAPDLARFCRALLNGAPWTANASSPRLRGPAAGPARPRLRGRPALVHGELAAVARPVTPASPAPAWSWTGPRTPSSCCSPPRCTRAAARRQHARAAAATALARS